MAGSRHRTAVSRSLAVALSCFTSACGMLVLLGWLLDVPVLKAPIADAPAMEVGSALAFIFGGLAVALAGQDGWRRRLATAAATVVALLAGINLFEDLAGARMGIDRALFGDATGIEGMAPLTAFIFLAISIGVLLFDPRRQRRVAVLGTVAGLCLVLALAAIAYYAAWMGDRGGRPLLMTMGPHTALLQFVHAFGLLALFVGFYSSERSDRLRMLLLSSSGAVALGSIAAWSFINWQESSNLRQEAEQRTAGVARLLEEHLHRSLDPADLVLTGLASKIARYGLTSVTNSPKEWWALVAMAESMPQVSAILIIDANGELRLSTVAFPAPAGNYAYRAYFQAHRDGAPLYLGPQIVAGVTGKPVFTYSRPLLDVDGNFAGVLGVTLDTEYFRSFYRSLGQGSHTAIGLFRRDGKLLVSDPMPSGPDEIELIPDPFFIDQINRSSSGSYVGRSPVDGEERLVSFRVSPTLQLVVTATMAMDYIVRPFERRFFASSAVLALVLAMLGTAVTLQLRSVRREARAREVAEAGWRFAHSVMDSVPPAIAILDRGGSIIDVNSPWRRFADGCGATAVGVGADYFEIAPKLFGDQASADVVLAGIGAVMTAETTGFEHVYGCRFEQQPHWFRMRARALRGTEGSVVVSHEDITDLKNAESALREAASTDFLTGLANRRTLMEAAEQELSRARRYQHPLSAMMIDGDRFKSVNDTYGHDVGDRVLKTLAVTMRQLCRGTDVVGRMGGEEFVILLPHTTEEGAVQFAERLRQTVADQALELGDGRVVRFTISIGVASYHPRIESVDALLRLADNALYAAKRNGRDRVEVAAVVDDSGISTS